MHEAGRNDQARAVLLDFDWLQAKLEASDVNALIADYDHLPEDKDLQLIQSTLGLSAHVLARDARQLAGQLTGWLLGFKACGVQELVKQASWWQASPWLRPLTPSLQSPGPLVSTWLADDTYARYAVNAVAVTADGRMLACACKDGSIHLLDPISFEEIHVPNPLRCEGAVNSVSFSKRADLLVVGCDNGTITLWNLTNWHVSTKNAHLAGVQSVALSDDGSLIASGSRDFSIKLWAVRDANEIDDGRVITLEGHTDYVNQVVFVRDSEVLVSTGNDRCVKMWDVRTAREPQEFAVNGQINSVAFSPDSTLVAANDSDGEINIIARRKQSAWTEEISPLKGRAASAVVFVDDNTVAVGGNDGRVSLWQFVAGKEFPLSDESDGAILCLAYSPKAHLLAAATNAVKGGGGCMVKVWDLTDLEAGKLVALMRGHTDSVRFVCFSPDGKFLASGGWDNMVKIWDLAKLARPGGDTTPAYDCYWTFQSNDDRPAGPATFSKDSKMLIYGAWSRNDHDVVMLLITSARPHSPNRQKEILAGVPLT